MQMSSFLHLNSVRVFATSGSQKCPLQFTPRFPLILSLTRTKHSDVQSDPSQSWSGIRITPVPNTLASPKQDMTIPCFRTLASEAHWAGRREIHGKSMENIDALSSFLLNMSCQRSRPRLRS